MNRQQLQAALKVYKSHGQTAIKLNAKTVDLQYSYDALQAGLVGQATELTCEYTYTAPVTVTPSEIWSHDVANLGSSRKPHAAPSKTAVKKAHKSQVASEVKRQKSQAPRHNTPVKDKYINKQVDEVRQQAIKGSSKKVACTFKKADEYGYHTTTTHKRFEGKREISWSPSVIEDTAVAATKAALSIVKGFVKQSFKAS